MLYNEALRRLLAITIALLIVLPVVSPLFAVGSAIDPSRPACCQRGGKHRCMLMDVEGSPTASTRDATHLTAASISERCPYGSKSLPRTTHPEWSVSTGAAIFAGILAHPSIAPQTESKRRISADLSRQKRGPPAIALA